MQTQYNNIMSCSVSSISSVVTRITRDTINELTIQPIITNIPNYQSFFYTFHTVAPIVIGRLQDDYIESTESIRGGYVLLTSDNIHPCSATEFLTSIKRLVDMYLHLMKGMQLLNSVSIVHLNICFRNIVVKDGLLPLLKGFEHATNAVSPDNMLSRPVECRAIKYIVAHKLASISLSSILDICGDNKEEQTFLSKYINKPTKFIIESLLQLSITWNVYSLNELFLGLLNNTHTPNSFLSKWKQCLERGTGTVGDRETPAYFIEQTRALMYDAEMSELTTATTSSATLL
jgi:hypothetical protein